MKHLIFKKHLLVIALLLFCGVSTQAADDDLITQQITIKLDKAGTLPDKIGNSKKYKITNLKIVGEINGTDLRLIRDMAGCDYHGNATSGNLAFLDLADAKIVSGGEYYYYERGIIQNCIGIYFYTTKNELGDNTFYGCMKLKKIAIPSNITSIGFNAFWCCRKLTSIDIPLGVTSIGATAFSGCSGLVRIYIPESVKSIDFGAFSGCNRLTSINIPPNVTSIEGFTFFNCSRLTSINIPSNITSIGQYAFAYCN